MFNQWHARFKVHATDIDGIGNRETMQGEHHAVGDLRSIFFGVGMRCFGKFKVEPESIGDVSAIPAGREPYERKVPSIDILMEYADLSWPEGERDVAILSGGMPYRERKPLEGLFGALGRWKAEQSEGIGFHRRENQKDG